jgi:hypothetical protein
VTGKITEYRGVPEIIVNEPEQIKAATASDADGEFFGGIPPRAGGSMTLARAGPFMCLLSL